MEMKKKPSFLLKVPPSCGWVKKRELQLLVRRHNEDLLVRVGSGLVSNLEYLTDKNHF